MLAQPLKTIAYTSSLATGAAILVCVVIVLICILSLVAAPLSGLVPVLFIVAMLALVSALAIFLCENLVATGTRRIGPR